MHSAKYKWLANLLFVCVTGEGRRSQDCRRRQRRKELPLWLAAAGLWGWPSGPRPSCRGDGGVRLSSPCGASLSAESAPVADLCGETETPREGVESMLKLLHTVEVYKRYNR